MKNTSIEIDSIDDPTIASEEQFFHIMSGAIMRLGIWGLELVVNAE